MSKKYEGLFIFSDSFHDEELEKIQERIRGEIVKLGGVVQGTQSMGRRPFSRPLHKKESGHYVRMDFTMDPEHMHALLGRLKLNEDIFRTQIVNAWARRDKVAAMAAQAQEKPDGQPQ
jgi:small subunit ribosomal protein S6